MRRARINPAGVLVILGVLLLVTGATALGMLGGVLVAVGSGALTGSVAALVVAWLIEPDSERP